MDVLVIVGDEEPPERVRARAGHVLRTPTAALGPDLLAELRTRIPREVAVTGGADEAAAAAVDLKRRGFPVTLWLDDPNPAGVGGIEIRPLSDPGPPMQTADSLLDMVGGTPMVRLDRLARHLDCHLLAKLELLNPGGSVKDRPAVAMIDAAERDGLLKPGGTIV